MSARQKSGTDASTQFDGNPVNTRPPSDDVPQPKVTTADEADPTADSEQVDRPGFDLGGSTGETRAGKGLGLGDDAKEGRKGWRLPR